MTFLVKYLVISKDDMFKPLRHDDIKKCYVIGDAKDIGCIIGKNTGKYVKILSLRVSSDIYDYTIPVYK